MPKRLRDGDSAIVPTLTDTGVVKRVAPQSEFLRDSSRAIELIDFDDIKRLPWKRRKQVDNWLYIFKSYRNFFNKKRVLWVYARPVLKDGSLGRRERMQYRVNGIAQEIDR